MQMGDTGPCHESTFEAADHKSFRNSPFAGEDQFDCRHKGIIEMDLFMKNLAISDEDDLNDLLFEEGGKLYMKNTIFSSIPDKKTLQFSSNTTSELKDLSKCAAILCSEALQSCPSIFAKVELSAIDLGYESYVAASNASEDSSAPYHESKFVSAIKGSRAKQGKGVDPNVRVTWAANVYDPPVTSSSHTVKGHRRRLPKAKHMKAKPSNASSGDRKKKHSHRRSSSAILDPRMGRMQGISRRSMDIAAAGGQESSSSKCAGSFHAKSSPWPLPLPIAEASLVFTSVSSISEWNWL